MKNSHAISTNELGSVPRPWQGRRPTQRHKSSERPPKETRQDPVGCGRRMTQIEGRYPGLRVHWGRGFVGVKSVGKRERRLRKRGGKTAPPWRVA